MKIDIEYEEVEKLMKKIERLEAHNKEIEEAFDKLDVLNLKNNAVTLANKIFCEVFDMVFTELGFEPGQVPYPTINFHELEHWMGAEWWKHKDKIKVELGATVSNRVARAFINIGIMPPKADI